MVRKALLGLLLVLLGSASAGCGRERPPYTPNSQLVAKLGEDAAKERLKKLISQAQAPQIDAKSVEIAKDYYFYQGLDMAMFGRGFMSLKVFYGQITKMEVWEDDGRHYVKLIGGLDEDGDEKRLDQLRFASAGEAREFADLLASLGAHLRSPQTKKPAAEPAAPAPAPTETKDESAPTADAETPE